MTDLNLDDLKKKFRKKATVNMEDVDLAMTAVPYLIRVIDELEESLEKSKSQIEYLQNRLNLKPVMSLDGSMGKATWNVTYESNNNLLVIILKGKFNSNAARKASKDVLSVSACIKDKFSVINNLYEVDPVISPKSLFHLKKATFNMRNHGMQQVVRVVNPEHTFFTKLFSGKSILSNSRTYIATDMDEALKILEDSGKHLIT